MGCGIFDCFFRDNFEPEVASDDISDADVGHDGMDIHVKFSDSRSIGSRDICVAHFVMDDER